MRDALMIICQYLFLSIDSAKVNYYTENILDNTLLRAVNRKWNSRDIESNNSIERFIEDILNIDNEKYNIHISLRKTILEICSDAQEEIKYGSLVFNVGSELVCGIFIRKNNCL